jgi:hypothetical protein
LRQSKTGLLFQEMAMHRRDLLRLLSLSAFAGATGGRLMGTLLSGVRYQLAGVTASLWGAVVLAAIAGVVAMFLPPVAATEVSWAAAKGDD